ncbi:hypothetical protein [Candidatus Stoquefichus sp. SB1]|uniref:hypothetical protein n=1 Tax=Candidatus Stoquefichus sp. SB1 TaxID=1658109 RepID=UPI00067EF63D|nr:hypothetical protein [Candidatus Stoquefichus sp. SB1]
MKFKWIKGFTLFSLLMALSLTFVSAAYTDLSCQSQTTLKNEATLKADCALYTLHGAASFRGESERYTYINYLKNNNTNEEVSCAAYYGKKSSDCHINVQSQYYKVGHRHYYGIYQN